MSNISPDKDIDFAKAFITTDSDTPVNVTILASIGRLEEVVPSAKDDLVKVPFPQELLVTQSDFDNREKGILIEVTSEGSISDLMQNFFEGSVGEYLAYPCMDAVLENYTYYAISTDSLHPEARSEILLIACHNDTNITITPTQPVVLPLDAQDPNSTNVTVPAGCSHTVILHTPQTLLVAVASNTQDLTGSKIVSSKPLTVISGHECGNVPQGVDYCEHLTVQIPPTVTWETSFLLPPLAIRRQGQIYRVIPSHDDTIITHTCESTTTTTTIPTAGIPYNLVIESDIYCTLVSNKPVFVTRWSLGAHTDQEGDPTVSPVAAVTQYINSVSFVNLPSFDWLNTYVSVMIPAELFTETSIIINDDISLDCPWQPFRNSTNGIVGYGCNSRAPEGPFTMKHNQTDGVFSVIPYGFEPYVCSGYAYIAGMKFDSTGMHVILHKHMQIMFYLSFYYSFRCSSSS